MSHVEYDEWAGLIGRVIDRFLACDRPSIFEIGAGTGVLGQRLSRRGYDYTGSDRCYSMCRCGTTRNIPFVCADGLRLPLKKRFDLILFLYDGINYLPTLDHYASLMEEVSLNLRDGGLFLFDITTEANSLSHFRQYLDFEDWGDYACIRRSYYRKGPMEQHNEFTIFKRLPGSSPLFEKIEEHHCQMIFPAAGIARKVPASRFSVEGIWDGYSFNRFRPHSERVHFLLRKHRR
ncbi:MAG: class I SAM-dependent methyltransferase [Chitinispirillaceae bacterium]|nr:class I SAM-dependent methyltransferase [Chitinispirillaceae bacterium]